ncbi:protein NLRC5-like [Amphiura filiformis]|uniref:protein NLRC5-like n=1 Tax=Amphiura filiformis TaxID=82378 RepID=UPI003B220C9B
MYMTEYLIKRIAEELKKHYRDHVCKKLIYPWDQTGKWMEFDKIYIPVTIDRDVGAGAKPIKESLESYEELFKIEEDKGHKRFLLVGDPGQGKSSFCAKVAHDWCVETTLENIQLLFIIDLAKVDKDTLIEDAICEHLLSDIDIEPTKLREVIKHLKQSIFFIFDGLDEAPGLMSSKVENKGGDGNRVTDVMKDQKLKDCRVLVTTRPWGEKEMKDIPGYKRLELKKMTRENVKKYVETFFGQDSETKSLGDSLVKFIDENKLTLDTSTPLIVLLVIYYWFETGGSSRIPVQLRILYDNIISIMYKKQPQHIFTK